MCFCYVCCFDGIGECDCGCGCYGFIGFDDGYDDGYGGLVFGWGSYGGYVLLFGREKVCGFWLYEVLFVSVGMFYGDCW